MFFGAQNYGEASNFIHQGIKGLIVLINKFEKEKALQNVTKIEGLANYRLAVIAIKKLGFQIVKEKWDTRTEQEVLEDGANGRMVGIGISREDLISKRERLEALDVKFKKREAVS